MSSAAEVLVVILSIFLAVFLSLGIYLMVYLIVLTHKIRKVAKSAEHTFENAGTILLSVSKIISPAFVADVVNKIMKKVKTKKPDSKKEDE